MKATAMRSRFLVSGAFLSLLACESADPGLEEEVSRLRQENNELSARLESAERVAREAQSRADESVSAMREETESAQAALAELQSRFDRKRLEASFAEAVSDFKQETLKKFPNHTISQVTMHQMVMPSDHPFSSGLTLVLNDQGSGSTRTMHVKALGNIDGEWTFKKVDADTIASNRPEAGAPPARNPGTDRPQPTPGSQPRSNQASPPVIRRTNEGGSSSSGGKVYRIDWGD